MCIINKLSKLFFDEDGFIFITDTVFSSMLILFMVLFFVLILNNSINLAIVGEKEKYLEEKTIFVADAFVKNFNEENTILGSCKIDFDKKRVLSNEIDSVNFSGFKQLNIKDFFVKEIAFESSHSKQIFFSDFRKSFDCISIKRFVFLDSIKGVMIFTGCLSE